MILSKLAGPIIGALIGYCTNYIAVKMLFYPKKEVRIFGHKLPFTPGAIPKGKPRLAKAIGTIVADDLLTEDDIRQKMISPETEHAVVDGIMAELSQNFSSQLSMLCPLAETKDSLKEKLITELSRQILDSVHHLNLQDLIVEKAGRAAKEKTKGTMLEMFLSDDLLNSLIAPAGDEIASAIDEKGPEFIRTELETKLVSLKETSVLELCRSFDLSDETLREIITGFYRKEVDSFVGKLVGNLDIAEIVKEKIDAMNVDNLEKLVLSVMKKELDTIVNLGAVVGAVLGILNIVF